MTNAPTDADSLALLRERHVFPGPFTFKVIGAPNDNFAERTRQAIADVVAPEAVPAPTVRASAKGNHHALTFVMQVAAAETVLAVYAALKAVKGVKFVL